MIVTIWWEDARQQVRSKAYGPDQFVAQCIVDDLGCTFEAAQRMFSGHPKKGAGTIKRLLKEDAALVLNKGPLCAVLDRDKILDWWPLAKRPNDCHAGICAAIRTDSSGDFYLVLLNKNTESLVDAACSALNIHAPEKSPLARDDVFSRLVFLGTAEQRRKVRNAVAGFDRLVEWIKNPLAKIEPAD